MGSGTSIDHYYLTGDEALILNPIIEQEGWTPINRDSIAIVAKDEDGIAGFFILRSIPHAEPMWIRPDLRKTSLAMSLASGMEQFLKETSTHGVVVIADNPVVQRMCESFGMRRVDSPVFILD